MSQRSGSRSSFASDESAWIRHELRTSVNHIIGYSELVLEEEDLPSALRNDLEAVHALAQQALIPIAEIQDVASGGTALESLVGVNKDIAARVIALPTDADLEISRDLERITNAAQALREFVDGLLRDDAGSVRPPIQESAPADEDGAGLATILVVDDDEANREVLSRRLRRLGYRVVEAGDGRSALDLMGAGNIDLVLLDLMMPVLDGYGVLEAQREHADLRDIPIVMISALDDLESMAKCIELGADDYLSKPFDPVLLKARVGACLEKKRLHDSEKQLLSTVTRQAEELRAWNSELERRVDEKVLEVERLSLMERFIPPQLAEVIATGGADLLKSHRREITVLFCDLRGFTPFAETAEPEDVMGVLRELHDAVGPLIFEHGGTLAQFTGDGMMVFFNDPIPCDEPAWAATQLALQMRARASQLSDEWRKRGHRLELGAGIAMGYATCGQIGFEGRYEYTAIGTVTNLASRLCGEAEGGQILVSGRVLSDVQDRVEAVHAGDRTLKGFGRPVSTYAVIEALR